MKGIKWFHDPADGWFDWRPSQVEDTQDDTEDEE